MRVIYVRLNVRVGLGERRCPDPLPIGIPSLIPFSPNEVRLSRRGNGILESGPANPERISYDVRRASFVGLDVDAVEVYVS